MFGNTQLDRDLDRNKEIIRILAKTEHKDMYTSPLLVGKVADQKGSIYLGTPQFERETVGRGASLDVKGKSSCTELTKIKRKSKNSFKGD